MNPNQHQTKRERQLINRAVGLTGSFMPRERAISIARKLGMDPTKEIVLDTIRDADQVTKKKVTKRHKTSGFNMAVDAKYRMEERAGRIRWAN